MKRVEYSFNVIINSMYENYLVRGGNVLINVLIIGADAMARKCAHYIKNGAIVIIIGVCF